MTTTASDSTSMPSEVWDELLASFAAKARPVSATLQTKPADGETKEPSAIQWLEPTAKALNRLPYQETNLPDGRIAPKPEAAAELLWTLLNALEDDTTPPTAIIPTSRGGVAAEWHVHGYDLEIECNPGGTTEYNFAGPNVEEYEGPAGPDLTQLRKHVAMLPKRAA